MDDETQMTEYMFGFVIGIFLRQSSFVLRHLLLMLEQPFLAPQTAAVSAQGAVSADHAVTRDDNADHVRAVRAANCSTRVFISQALRHPGIRACFAYGNRLQNLPSPQLKRRTNRRQWNIELQIFTREVIGQLRTDRFQMPMFSRHD